MKRYPVTSPVLLCFGIGAAMAANATAGAAELSFGHFAPAAGSLRLEADGASLAMAEYRDFVPSLTLAPGRHVLKAVAADGRELASGELSLRTNDAVTVMVAGNGSAAAPYELRLSVDHNHPLRAEDFSLQRAGLAISATAAVELREACEESSTPPRAYPYGSGSAPMNGTQESSANMSRGPLADRCAVELFVGGEPRMSRELPTAAGTRARAFAIGDGTNEPYEVVVVQQGARPEHRLPLGPGVAGLWYPAGEHPGISVVVSFDDDQPEGRRFSAIVSGYDHELQPTWRVIDADLQISEYRGGNPAGTRPALPHTQGRLAEVVWHSCSELTLVPIGGEGTSGVFNPMPRDAMRLKRLLPAHCEAAASQEEAL